MKLLMEDDVATMFFNLPGSDTAVVTQVKYNAKKATADKTRFAISESAEIFGALISLGYCLKDRMIVMDLQSDLPGANIRVSIGDEYIGIWDPRRKTFVD